MRNTGTVYQSKGRWYTGNFVRFFQDTIQPIGGWSARSLSGATISGVPRAMVLYQRQTGSAATPALVIATTRGLYVIVSGVKYDITPAAIGSTVTARHWQLDVFGNYLVAVDIQVPGDAGRMYYWAGDTGSVAVNMPDYFDSASSPYAVYGVVASPERFLVALGGPFQKTKTSGTSGLSQPRTVMWASQETGFTAGDWTPGTTNTAGSLPLSTDGQLVCGRRTRNGTLIWTTTDLWLMTHIGGEFVHRIDQAGARCGIISPNAAVVNDTAAFWMGHQGFYTYDGFVKPLPCDVHDYVFGSLNRTYTHYIWAMENPVFGEITWFYPHAAQTEITRYVTYNYRENHWVTGALARTCGVPLQPGNSTIGPVMCNPSASVFDHETGTGRNSEGTPSLESGPIEIGDGDRLLEIQKVLPDDKTVGDVNLTLYGAFQPDASETSYGPTTLTAQTSLRVKARQIRVKLTEAVANAWRVGVIRLGVIASSRR